MTSAAPPLGTGAAQPQLHVSELSSSLQHFGLVDYFVFVTMLVVCAAIGIYFGFVEKRKGGGKGGKDGKDASEGEEQSEALDYLVGGRKMKVFPVSMSLVASFVSGISLLGTSTEIYVYGTQYAFILVAIAISGVISWVVFLPVFCNLRLTSTYEYFELRFDKRIRLFGSILFTIGTIFWLPIVIYVPALAFNQVTGVNIHVITPIVCVVCIFYTCVGGLKAVVWTDVIQIFVMVGSIVLVMVKGTMDVGGIGVVFQRNFDSGRLETPQLTIDPTVRYSYFSLIIGGAVYWVNDVSGNQVMMQRFLSLPSTRHAKKALFIFIVGVSLLLACTMYNGLLIFARFHDCDPLSTKLAKAKDQLVPLLVMDTLGVVPGLPGLFVAGVFSAALSSLSTGLNSLSAVFLEDFIKPYIRYPLSERKTAIIMRSVVVLLGALCVVLVFVVERLGMVLQLSMTLNSISVGPLFGIFFMGLCLPWIKAKSAFIGSITSFCAMAYICARAQIAQAYGEMRYVEKPLTTSGCLYTFDAVLKSAEHFTPLADDTSKSLHHMSFLWYVPFGAVLAITVSLLSSLYYGFQDPNDLDPAVITPIVRHFIKPREYLSTQPDVKEREAVILAFDVSDK